MQLNIRMDRQRQIKDIAHPMYEIIDNALPAVDDYTNHYYGIYLTVIMLALILLVFHPECLQELQNL